ncbi:4Fe-4S ferredoxin, iron-sulfur binding [Bradyrhizobium sp. STM 3843]|uniref:4Fe-4S dicluster domain-containing protein n=1 Tax=Bradyrhizobium sp. STM 3843 TaxID=551947 RepID=UPI0002403792|nr:4Fe-4S dicluster domain-containing protein [Bradyrhizobium sp. STM 3843]CCE07802.1 4Fe-4S ferredoxin, iron-sulfur binding [Bradyrhizobium sp. STM 3843]
MSQNVSEPATTSSDGTALPVRAAAAVISRDGLQALIDALAADHCVLGPTVRDGAIVYDEIAKLSQLPAGWTDNQDAGRYRLERRADDALFGFAVGPESWKRFLHPPVETLWTARRDNDGFSIEAPSVTRRKFAFIGVRACEIHAMAIQDKVFLAGAYADPGYGSRRRDAFIVAVNCAEAGGTCFCVSMGTGPQAESGFDLALTELHDGSRHDFLVEVGSDEGASLLSRLPQRRADDADLEAAAAVIAQTRSQMGRTLDTDGIKDLLQTNANHPRWDDVAARCLTCGNCTMVCPTCFCTTVEDHSDLAGATAERVRKWDSCFTLDFSYLHGGSVRQSGSARYRQWITHKLASWIDQFGTSGCVGCGRCITWCPVGIDITEEAAAIRAHPTSGGQHGGT